MKDETVAGSASGNVPATRKSSGNVPATAHKTASTLANGRVKPLRRLNVAGRLPGDGLAQYGPEWLAELWGTPIQKILKLPPID